MSIFNKERLEDLIKQTKKSIYLSEKLIENNPNVKNINEIKSLIDTLKKSLEDYIYELENNHLLLISKKVTLRLKKDEWNLINEKAEGNQSKYLQEIISNALNKE